MSSSTPARPIPGVTSLGSVPQAQIKSSADVCGSHLSQPRSDDLINSTNDNNGCGLCRNKGDWVEFPGLLNLEDLLYGEPDCYWYHLFIQSIRKCAPSLLQDTDAFRKIGCSWQAYQSKEESIHPLIQDSERSNYFRTPPLRWANFHHKNGNDGSSGNTQQAINWFRTCKEAHPDCRPKHPEFLPSRLLDIGGRFDEFESVADIRLVDTETLSRDSTIEYASLSHCWGGVEPPCITTTETIDDNKCNIPWSRIPRTFQDAIKIVRSLGLQYLWIDSLCIIQGKNADAVQDWLKEAALMAKIYSNSTITVGAVSSGNCNAGLYRNDTSRFHAVELRLLETPDKYRKCWHREHTDTAQLPGTPFKRIIAQNRTTEWYEKNEVLMVWDVVPPLASRAWFFQEWQLSPRMLHFDLGELVWQCNRGYISQSHAAICQGFQGRPSLVPHWHETVQRYSKLHLTFHRDKLQALSGVVKSTWQYKRGHSYAAGLWQEAMPWDLAWEVESHKRSPKPEEFAAPSWSWASVKDQVKYEWHPDNRESRLNCVIQDFQCVPKGDDHTGALKSASLTIVGLMCPCELHYVDTVPTFDCEEGFGRVFTYDSDGIMAGGYRVRLYDSDGSIRQWVEFFSADYDLHKPGKGYIAPTTRLQCLWIIVIDLVTDFIWIGLVLSPSSQVAGAYERIGLVYATSVKETECLKSVVVIV